MSSVVFCPSFAAAAAEGCHTGEEDSGPTLRQVAGSFVATAHLIKRNMNLDGLLPTETFSAILGLARAASPVSTWTPPNSGGEVRVPIWDHRHQVKLTGADAPTEDELPRFLANNPACSVYSSLSPSECHHSDGGCHEDDELPCLDNRVLERPTARKRGLSPTPAGVGEDSSRRRPNRGCKVVEVGT